MKFFNIFLCLISLHFTTSCRNFDPENNTEDGYILWKGLNTAINAHASAKSRAAVAYDIRAGAISSGVFSKVELHPIKDQQDGELFFGLILEYSPCFKETNNINERRAALHRTFGNFSFLNTSKEIKNPERLKDPNIEPIFRLRKGDVDLGSVIYRKENTFINISTDSPYDEVIERDAVQADNNEDLHKFNLLNILNKSFDGYCHFSSFMSSIERQELLEDGRLMNIFYVESSPTNQGRYCEEKFQNVRIPETAVLKAFTNHPQYKIKPTKEASSNSYSIIHINGWKRGELHFKNNFLDRLLVVGYMSPVR